MPAPMLSSLAAMSGKTAVATTVSGAASSIFDPFTRVAATGLNVLTGGMWPDYGSLIAAHYRGFLSTRDFNLGLQANGIQTGAGTTPKCSQIWDAIHRSHLNRISLEDALTAHHRGQFDRDKLNTLFERNALWSNGDRELLINPPNPPPLAFLLELMNRGMIVENEAMDMLKALGYGRNNDRLLIAGMRFNIPGPPDLIRFSVREVWDDDVVRRFGYDLEFPEAFQYWMEKHGLAYSPDSLYAGVPVGGNVPWTRAYWRSHWEVLSPHQAYEAYHRLRPNRLGQFRHINREIQPFTIDDLKTVLKIHDYPAPVRDWLAAIAHHPLTRVDIRRMRKLNILTAYGVEQAYLDLGYSPTDAKNLADFTEADLQATKTNKDNARIKTNILNAYETGILPRDDALWHLWRLLHGTTINFANATPDETADYRRQASSNEEIAMLLDAIDLKIANQLAKDSVRTIRKSFLDGVIDEANATMSLLSIPIQRNRIATYLQTWRMLRERKSRQATAAMIAGWFKDALISRKDAFTRLLNLGYKESDANLILEKASATTRQRGKRPVTPHPFQSQTPSNGPQSP